MQQQKGFWMAHLDGAIVEEAVDDLLLCCRHGLVQEAHAILQRVQQRLVVHVCQVGLQVSRLQLHKGAHACQYGPRRWLCW